ncbi:MAG: 30S ribosomal protein S18 [Chlamydiae bacterium]|nr:30S ribosomal protein S18 [Chlamydiota bacterium]MBI3266184.1 30S ribosomal protein S18 [Chlamydiota bacterium]
MFFRDRDDRRRDDKKREDRKAEREEKVIRKKKCKFCLDNVEAIDYKDTNRLRKNLTERGKIIPRRITGNCSSHERQLAEAVKRARYIALIPHVIDQ